jgi:hypothetical protein
MLTAASRPNALTESIGTVMDDSTAATTMAQPGRQSFARRVASDYLLLSILTERDFGAAAVYFVDYHQDDWASLFARFPRQRRKV